MKPIIVFIKSSVSNDTMIDNNNEIYKLILFAGMKINEINDMIQAIYGLPPLAFEDENQMIIPTMNICRNPHLFEGRTLSVVLLNSTMFSIRGDESYMTYDRNDLKDIYHLAQHSGITLESLWGQFKSVATLDGWMDLPAFSECIQGLCARSNLNFVGKDLWTLFDMFDVDNNGQVRACELACALTVLAGGDKQSKLWLGFNLIDADQDGFISLDELSSWLLSYLHVIIGLSDLKNHHSKQTLYVCSMRSSDVAARAIFKLSSMNREKSDVISFQELQNFMNAFPLFLQWFRVLDVLDNMNDNTPPEVQTLLHGITTEDLETMLVVRANSTWDQVDLPDTPIDREMFLGYMHQLINSSVADCVYDDVFVSLECLFDSLAVEDEENLVEPVDLVIATMPLSQTPFVEQLKLAFAYNGDPDELSPSELTHMLRVYILAILCFSQTSRDLSPHALNLTATDLAIAGAIDMLGDERSMTWERFISIPLPLWFTILQVVAAPSSSSTNSLGIVRSSSPTLSISSSSLVPLSTNPTTDLTPTANDPIENVQLSQLNDLALISHFTNILGANALIRAIQSIEFERYVNLQDFLSSLKWPSDLFRLLASKLFLTIDTGNTDFVHADELCLAIILTIRAPLIEKWDWIIEMVFGEDISFNAFALIVRAMLKLMLGSSVDIDTLDKTAVGYALNIYKLAGLSHDDSIEAYDLLACVETDETIIWMDVFWSDEVEYDEDDDDDDEEDDDDDDDDDDEEEDEDYYNNVVDNEYDDDNEQVYTNEAEIVVDIPFDNGADIYNELRNALSDKIIPDLVELYSQVITETSKPRQVYLRLCKLLFNTDKYDILFDNVYTVFENAAQGTPDMKTLLIPLMFLCSSQIPIPSKILTVWMIFSDDEDENRLTLTQIYELVASFMKFIAVINVYEGEYLDVSVLDALCRSVARRAEEIVVQLFTSVHQDVDINTMEYEDFMNTINNYAHIVPWLHFLVADDLGDDEIDDDEIILDNFATNDNNNNINIEKFIEEYENEYEYDDDFEDDDNNIYKVTDNHLEDYSYEVDNNYLSKPTATTLDNDRPITPNLNIQGRSIAVTPTGTRVRPRANSAASSDGEYLYCDYEPASPSYVDDDDNDDEDINRNNIHLPIIGRKLISPLPFTNDEVVEEVILIDDGNTPTYDSVRPAVIKADDDFVVTVADDNHIKVNGPKPTARTAWNDDGDYTTSNGDMNSNQLSADFVIKGRGISVTPTGTRIQYRNPDSDVEEEEEVIDIDLAVTGKKISTKVANEGSFTFESVEDVAYIA